MSTDTSPATNPMPPNWQQAERQDTPANQNQVPWNPWLGAIFIPVIFFVTQFVAGLALSAYPYFKHWTNQKSHDWLTGSVSAQFIYILLAESLVIGSIYALLRHYKVGWASIGLGRLPKWGDVGSALLVVIPYYLIFMAMTYFASTYIPSFNADQQQQIGFNNVHGGFSLTMTFISLVILPPLAEEIMVRGFLYSSLKKAMKIIYAAIITSLIFGAAHLPEGGAAGPLWIGALDTFILSLFLIYLREKTGSLWSSMTLHAIKNGLAFVLIFMVR